MKTLAALLTFTLTLFAAPVSAQETYPSRPIRIVVGFSPGGSTDILARVVGQRLSEIKNAAGITMTHVPYKGPGEQIQDALAGRVDLALVPVNAAKAHVDSGRLVALAVTTQRRSSVVDAPTVAEGGVADYEFTPWFGLLAPAATPRTVVDRLNAQVMAAINHPEVRAKLQAQGAEPMQMSATEFDGLVRSEVTRFARVFREAGVQRQ